MAAKRKTSKTSTKKTRKLTRSKKNKRDKSSRLKRFTRFSLKLGSGLCLVLALYLIYLDSKISQKFEGNKWQLPVQVYARAMQFTEGQYLSVEAHQDQRFLKCSV